MPTRTIRLYLQVKYMNFLLHLGSKGQHVEPVKKWLILLSSPSQELTTDDFYDSSMMSAVRQFQLQNDALEPHGYIDDITLYNIMIRIDTKKIEKELLTNTPFRMMIASMCVPYDDEVHMSLTYALALAAGFTDDRQSNRAAFVIAAADVGVDYDPSTQPMPAGAKDVASGANHERLELWHFVTPARLKAVDERWRGNGSLRDLGMYMHVLQDTFSHRGFGPGKGQMGSAVDEEGNVVSSIKPTRWHEVDDPSKRPKLAFEMASEVFNTLCEAVKICQSKKTIKLSYSAVTWESIKDEIWNFCNEKDANKREKIATDLAGKFLFSHQQIKNAQLVHGKASGAIGITTSLKPVKFRRIKKKRKN